MGRQNCTTQEIIVKITKKWNAKSKFLNIYSLLHTKALQNLENRNKNKEIIKNYTRR